MLSSPTSLRDSSPPSCRTNSRGWRFPVRNAGVVSYGAQSHGVDNGGHVAATSSKLPGAHSVASSPELGKMGVIRNQPPALRLRRPSKLTVAAQPLANGATLDGCSIKHAFLSDELTVV